MESEKSVSKYYYFGDALFKNHTFSVIFAISSILAETL